MGRARSRREEAETLRGRATRARRALPAYTSGRGLILEVRARELDLLDTGGLCKARGRPLRQDLPSLDHAWLTREEWRSLAPGRSEVGFEYSVPSSIARRIARFHLVDNTRGEPNLWAASEIRRLEMKPASRTNDQRIVVALEGSAHLETKDAERGFEPRLQGVLELDRGKNVFRRFDVVAVGEHWGAGTYTEGARPGRSPLGIAFQIAAGDDPADTIPPQAARNIREYFDP